MYQTSILIPHKLPEENLLIFTVLVIPYGIIKHMKKLNDEDKKLIDSVVQVHAPWINRTIKMLKATGKIGPQFEEGDFYEPGYNAIVEALASYDPSKSSFKTHAQNLLKHRIMGHVEKEMSRSGGGGLDPYFLNQARSQRKEQEFQQKQQEIKAPAVSTKEPSKV